MAGGDGPVRLTAGILDSRSSALDAATLYAILRLRAAVFVVEQACVYLDPDGRDLEATTIHCWVPGDDGGVDAYLRILAQPGGSQRIGRVVTAPSARGRGLAAGLIRHALTLTAGPVVLHAQSHLRDWYAGFGFVPDGAEFVEDDILHLPMRHTG